MISFSSQNSPIEPKHETKSLHDQITGSNLANFVFLPDMMNRIPNVMVIQMT